MAAPDTYPLIREAILHERQVIADYKKLRRQLCPHAIGCKAGRPQALFYQFAGFSEHGLGEDGSHDNWRCLALADLTIIEIREGPWHTGTGHSRASTCLGHVDVSWWELKQSRG